MNAANGLVECKLIALLCSEPTNPRVRHFDHKTLHCVRVHNTKRQTLPFRHSFKFIFVCCCCINNEYIGIGPCGKTRVIGPLTARVLRAVFFHRLLAAHSNKQLIKTTTTATATAAGTGGRAEYNFRASGL